MAGGGYFLSDLDQQARRPGALAVGHYDVSGHQYMIMRGSPLHGVHSFLAKASDALGIDADYWFFEVVSGHGFGLRKASGGKSAAGRRYGDGGVCRQGLSRKIGQGAAVITLTLKLPGTLRIEAEASLERPLSPDGLNAVTVHVATLPAGRP